MSTKRKPLSVVAAGNIKYQYLKRNRGRWFDPAAGCRIRLVTQYDRIEIRTSPGSGISRLP